MTVVFCPDYIVYRDRYCTDAVFTFSSSSIEIKGSTAYEDQGTFVFQCGLDGIIGIESQWCQKVSFILNCFYGVLKLDEDKSYFGICFRLRWPW